MLSTSVPRSFAPPSPMTETISLHGALACGVIPSYVAGRPTLASKEVAVAMTTSCRSPHSWFLTLHPISFRLTRRRPSSLLRTDCGGLEANESRS